VPREIEDALMRHPAVAEAAVVAKKDPSRGEVPVAFVTLKPGQTATPEALREFARNQNLAQFKVPREVQIVEELPRSPTGKVLKRVLSERANA
jgi:long-chain acyl-CoA synthetase